MAKFDIVKAVTEDGAKLKAEITNLSRREKSRVRELTVIGIGVVLHAIKHGDVTLATAFVSAIKGHDANSMRKWLLVFGPFQWGTVMTKDKDGADKESKGFVYDQARAKALKEEVSKDRPGYIHKMNAETYTDLDPPVPFQGFDFAAALSALVKRADRVAKTHPNDPKVKLDGLAEARAILGEVSTEDEETEAAAA